MFCTADRTTIPFSITPSIDAGAKGVFEDVTANARIDFGAGALAKPLAGQSRLRFLGGVAFALLALGTVKASAKASLDAPIVVTQVPASIQAPPSDWDSKDLVRCDWFDGARIAVVSPDGQVRVLSEGFQSACDPNVSFDGQRVLFAGRKERNAHWRIWEIGFDGKGLRAISPENMDARSPIYVSTLFTLDSPQPWFTTVFVGREPSMNEVGRASVSSLYNIKLDGTELRRLTFNPDRNIDPFQMWDGRVIYAAERHTNEPGSAGGRVGLYAIHMEGADMESYGGDLGSRIQQMPCATAGGLVIFVESSQPTWDGAGQLACVEERRPHPTYRALTEDAGYVFLYPSPLRDNQVLVSRRPATGGGNFGVYCFDADRGQCELIFDSPDFHDVQAVLAKPRNRPDGHSTVVTTTNDFGTLYGLNCYTTDAMRDGHLKQGEIKRVRFIEGVARTAAEPAAKGAAQGPFIPRRLVGEAPVETDGSFNVIVPADTPLLLQTLDEHGLALGNCGWIWVKPKETRGCIGCHENPELTPENEFVLALRHLSTRLLPPPEQRRSVAFRQDIAPIFQRSCATADCHGGFSTPLHLPLVPTNQGERELVQAYETLTAPAGKVSKDAQPWPPAPGKYVDAGRARTSWLVWELLGGNTSRPWDQDAKLANGPPRKAKLMPPAGKGIPLNDEELRTVIQWIDMGAQFEAAKPSEAETKKEGGAK
jgi:hypothetical protein